MLAYDCLQEEEKEKRVPNRRLEILKKEKKRRIKGRKNGKENESVFRWMDRESSDV